MSQIPPPQPPEAPRRRRVILRLPHRIATIWAVVAVLIVALILWLTWALIIDRDNSDVMSETRLTSRATAIGA